MRDKNTIFFQLGFMSTGIAMALTAHKRGESPSADDILSLKSLEKFFQKMLNTWKFIRAESLSEMEGLDIDFEAYGIFLTLVTENTVFAIKLRSELENKLTLWKETAHNLSLTPPENVSNSAIDEILVFLRLLADYCLARLSTGPF